PIRPPRHVTDERFEYLPLLVREIHRCCILPLDAAYHPFMRWFLEGIQYGLLQPDRQNGSNHHEFTCYESRERRERRERRESSAYPCPVLTVIDRPCPQLSVPSPLAARRVVCYPVTIISRAGPASYIAGVRRPAPTRTHATGASATRSP